MDYNSPTSNSFKKCSKMIFLSIYCLPKSFVILCKTWTIKRQKMAKMNEDKQ